MPLLHPSSVPFLLLAPILLSSLCPTTSARFSDETIPLPSDQLWGDDTLVAVTDSFLLLCSPSVPNQLRVLRRHSLFGWRPLDTAPFLNAPVMPDEFTCSSIVPGPHSGTFHMLTTDGELYHIAPEVELVESIWEYRYVLSGPIGQDLSIETEQWYQAVRRPTPDLDGDDETYGFPQLGSGGRVRTTRGRWVEPEPAVSGARCGTSVDAAYGHGQYPVLIGCPGVPSAWISYTDSEVSLWTESPLIATDLELPLPDFINSTDSDFGAMVAIPDSANVGLIESHYVLAVAAPSAGNITFYWMPREGGFNYDYTGDVEIVTTVSAPGPNVRPIVWMRPTEQAVVFMTEDLHVYVASLLWRDREPAVEVEQVAHIAGTADVDSVGGVSANDNGVVALVRDGEVHVIRLLCGDGVRQAGEICDNPQSLFCTEFCGKSGTAYSVASVGSFLVVSGLLLMRNVQTDTLAEKLSRTRLRHMRAGHADILRFLALLWIPTGLVTMWAVMEASVLDPSLVEVGIAFGFLTLIPAALLWVTADLAPRPWAVLTGLLALVAHVVLVSIALVPLEDASNAWWGVYGARERVLVQSTPQLVSLGALFACHMLLGSAMGAAVLLALVLVGASLGKIPDKYVNVPAPLGLSFLWPALVFVYALWGTYW